MTAILFGSISTLADTSELQRDAFNRAFAEHGLDWQWDQAEYARLLESNGGRDRVSEYARSRGEDVDAGAVHATKSRFFQESLAAADVAPRDGVVETIQAAREQGLKVGLVTTTSADNLTALGRALEGSVSLADLDVVVDASQVDQPKPDAAAYAHALRALGEQPGDCVAVEDNLGGVQAARAAGVPVVAFPNTNTAGHDFGTTPRVDALDLADLRRARA